MKPLPPKLEALLLELDGYDEQTKMDLLIEYAERFQQVPAEIALRPYSKDHLVPGCESEAYVWSRRLGDAAIRFYFAVENPQGISAKALAAIISETVNGESASSVEQIPDDVVYRMFGRTLSMGKGQGLMGMIRMLKILSRGDALGAR